VLLLLLLLVRLVLLVRVLVVVHLALVVPPQPRINSSSCRRSSSVRLVVVDPLLLSLTDLDLHFVRCQRLGLPVAVQLVLGSASGLAPPLLHPVVVPNPAAVLVVAGAALVVAVVQAALLLAAAAAPPVAVGRCETSSTHPEGQPSTQHQLRATMLPVAALPPLPPPPPLPPLPPLLAAVMLLPRLVTRAVAESSTFSALRTQARGCWHSSRLGSTACPRSSPQVVYSSNSCIRTSTWEALSLPTFTPAGTSLVPRATRRPAPAAPTSHRS
jgi:hypothetical protein